MRNVSKEKMQRKRIKILTRMLNDLCASLEEKSDDEKLIWPVEHSLIRDIKGLERWRKRQKRR